MGRNLNRTVFAFTVLLQNSSEKAGREKIKIYEFPR